jgi:predicted CopG family antitoxin
MTRSTITVRQEVKDRLAQAKGGKTWDEFLEEVANERLDDAIALAERRLEELRTHKVRTVSLAELEQDIDKLEKGKGTADEGSQARGRRQSSVGRATPPGGKAGGPGPRGNGRAAGS